MRVLFAGDVVGKSGRRVLKRQLPLLKKEYSCDFVIVNGENSASGFGMTDNIYKELLNCGADAVTGGNHTWDRPDVFSAIDNWDKFVRPANYPENTPGHGYRVFEVAGERVVIINLLGRIFMNPIDDPFRVFDAIYEKFSNDTIIVDFHAEATSEKNAFGLYVDGRAAAVIGTHTHVQTNDMRFLPKGTVYLTDAGMCGSLDSVIGMDKELSINKFITYIGKKFEVEKTGRMVFNGIVMDVGNNMSKPLLSLVNILDETL